MGYLEYNAAYKGSLVCSCGFKAKNRTGLNIHMRRKKHQLAHREAPKPGEVWRHYKGQLYEVVCYALNERHPDEMLIIYRELNDGATWCRPLNEFIGKTVWATPDETAIVQRFTFAYISKRLT